jgi:DNA polymerase epsilon subunit 2
MNRPTSQLANNNPIPSSSPAFGTPVHPINVRRTAPIPPPQLKPTTILPILLPPPTLRPLAFRTFTKKHNLTLTSSALAALATFIGRHCGSGWREDGLAEGVLEEVAKMWKKESGVVIVEGDGDTLKSILKALEGSMSGGRIQSGKSSLSRQTSFAFSDTIPPNNDLSRPSLDSHNSFGMSSLEVRDEDEDEDKVKDPREWIKVIGAFDQPRLVYNVSKKHFDRYIYLEHLVVKVLMSADPLLKVPYCLHLLIGQTTFASVTTLSTNESCETSPFRQLPFQEQNKRTKSHQYRTY